MSGDGWSGSNHDVGSFSEVDEELRHRITVQDANLMRVHEAEEEYLAAMKEYLALYAQTVTECPDNWTVARKEREAKTVNWKARVRYERAKVAWEAAKLYAEIQDRLINAVQSRGANVRKQADLEAVAHQRIGEVRNDPLPHKAYRRLDTDCAACGEPQYDTPSGPCCENGHGGEGGVPRNQTATASYYQRRRKPF